MGLVGPKGTFRPHKPGPNLTPLFPRKQPSLLDRPGAIQGAKRTLDGEDRSGIIKDEGKGETAARWSLHKRTVTQQFGAQRVLKGSVTIPDMSKRTGLSQPAILQLPEHKTAPGWQVRQFGTGPQFTVSEERSGYIALRRR